MENKGFEEWAVLELMGHRRLAGKITDAVIGGGAFIRIDIPTKDGNKATQFYSPGSVYCITPTTEEIARMIAVNSEPEPISRWEIRNMLSAGNENRYAREGMPEIVHTDSDPEDDQT